MIQRLLPACLLLAVACTGPGASASRPIAVTVGSLSPGGRMAQVLSNGSNWSIEFVGEDLVLRRDGSSATFHDVASAGRVDYRYDQQSATWTFLLEGGLVHWRGAELSVGEEKHELEAGAALEFVPADWSAPE